jgi:hypothetical protein
MGELHRLPPASSTDPADCLTYFWDLVEATTQDDINYLWPDFEHRARELRVMARTEDTSEAVWHLGRALDQSELWSKSGLRAKRAAILRALRAAGS